MISPLKKQMQELSANALDPSDLMELEERELSRIRSKQMVYSRANRFSMGMNSIAGVSIMSPLMPKGGLSVERGNVYSVKDNYMLRDRPLRNLSRVEISRDSSKRELPSDFRKPELSSQEHLEIVWSSKLVEKLRARQKQHMPQDKEEAKTDPQMEGMVEDKKSAEEWRSLDKYLEDLLANAKEAIKKFLYFNVKRASDPYDLVLTTYGQRDVDGYYTISGKGVTYYFGDNAVDFVTLEEWILERDLYSNIKGIGFFRNFKRWKLLKSWRQKILSAKRKQIVDELNDKLFYTDKMYQSFLLLHRKSMCQMSKLRLIDLSRQEETATVKEFVKKQRVKSRAASDKIKEFSDNCRLQFKALMAKALNKLRESIRKEDNVEELKLGAENETGGNPAFEALNFPGSLTYGNRAALRRECTRFLRLAYLVDFVAVESLGDIYLNSVEETLRSLDQLDAAGEVEVVLAQEIAQKNPVMQPVVQLNLLFNPNEISEQHITLKEVKEFSGKLSKPKDFNLFCHIELAPAKEEPLRTDKKCLAKHVPNLIPLWLSLSPDILTLTKLLKDLLEKGIDAVTSFERWSKHLDLAVYADVLEEWDEVIGGNWEDPESELLDPLQYISESAVFQEKDKRVQRIVASAYKKAEEVLSRLYKYLYAYWMNDKADFGLLFSENLLNPLDTLTNVLKLLEYQKTKFGTKIPRAFNLGMLRIDCAGARRLLIPSPKNAMKKIESISGQVIRAQVEEVRDWIVDSRKQLLSQIVEVDDYVRQKNAWNTISNSYQPMKDKIDTCESIYNILTEYGIKVQKKDKGFHTEVLQDIIQLSQLVAGVADQQELNLDRIKRLLRDSLVPGLRVRLETLRSAVQSEDLLRLECSVEETLGKVEGLEAEFGECESLAEKYLSYQQVLNMESIEFPLVEEIREELSLRGDMWRSLKNWKLLTQGWITQQFSTINSKEISTKAEEYAKISRRVEKGLPENSVAKELKELVDTFRKTVPVVKAFSNKALEKAHWGVIKDLLNADFDITAPSFTLQSLLDLKVVDHQEEIDRISQQAYQEALLKAQLTQLDDQWKRVAFTLKQYKHKDVYVLDEVDVLLSVVDESLANVNTVLGSRYVKPLLGLAEGWRNSLLSLQTVVDEWVACQKRWIYLENIFSGQDIKKQLANEAMKFDSVDKFFKGLMVRTSKMPQPFRLIKNLKYNLLATLRGHNKTLDEIEKLLEDYLETKRRDFPRFYFLSNDELLEILANQQRLETVQQSLRKCFDNLFRLDVLENLDIVAMHSSEGERVPLARISKAKDNVEVWLDTLQSNMRDTLSKAMKTGLQDYDMVDRKDWVLKHYGQIVSTGAQVTWSATTEAAILEMAANPSSLLEWYEENVGQIQQLTELVRGKLEAVQRKVVVALVTTDVHARDIVEGLVLENVSQLNDFNWQKQLRYYWDDEDYVQQGKGCYIRQVAARLEYGYEYIGPSSRLVITPLTDRCWVTITGALNIHLGAAPAGPAGTGKTESTKDLAKGLGMYCIVFNCSEQINYKMMARLFSGVVQQGAWTCLDEFNRINVEVLSVVARQVMDIRMALTRGDEVFTFEDKEIRLRGNCGIFITMNPGYAGRTELPDNLKVHFRPVSMMIPDYELIAEIMLFAEGFAKAKALSKKMVNLYKLASEQLSQQDHYDFGMRAVKSVLIMAGSLKRAEPELSEDAVLLRAMRDSNIPKFIKEDLPLFHALIKDLFPTLEVEAASYGELQVQIEESMKRKCLQKVPEFILKVLQLYEITTIRFGVMIVGPTGGGKTSCFEVLHSAMAELHSRNPGNEAYCKVNVDILNPKAVSLGELYGEVNPSTQEWSDGLASKLIRRAAEDGSAERFWIVFDGPVDSLWIENMNTVLDDTMTLCLSNGQRIKLRSDMKMLFEVQDLATASPATVSRCGMVYMAGDTIGWRSYVQTWIAKIFVDESVLDEAMRESLLNLFDQAVDRGLGKIRSGLREPIATVDLQLVAGLCNFLEVLLVSEHLGGDASYKKKVMTNVFMYSYIWGLCTSIDDSSKEKVVYIRHSRSTT